MAVALFRRKLPQALGNQDISRWIKLHGTSICMAPRPDDSVPYRLPVWMTSGNLVRTHQEISCQSFSRDATFSVLYKESPPVYFLRMFRTSTVKCFSYLAPIKTPSMLGTWHPSAKKSDGSLSYLILSGTVSAGELCMPKCSPSKLRCFVLSSKWEPGRTCRHFGNALPAPVPEMDWNMVSKQDEAPRIRKIKHKHGHGSKKKAGLKMIGR